MIDNDDLALLKFGIKAGSQKQQILKMIQKNQSLRQDYQKIKSSLKTMTDQNQYLNCITTSHQNICDNPENNKIILLRDGTYQIRAINPQNIQSLIQRAFFNSFNLQRIVLNDLQQQNNILEAQKGQRSIKQRDNQQQKQQQIQSKFRNQDQQNCICGKIIPQSHWVMCSNQNKCRGSSWYHIQCAGLDGKDLQKIKQKDFICQSCRRQDQQDDQQSQSQIQKKLKK